ncbi:S-layer homology domain-containing protein, partial [bacterium]|nr:S-layer homology domain-containing protein [bacterium]
MHRKFLISAILLTPLATRAAPLFPDALANHWAADALRRLAEQGLVEGYRDGTFKGDRAASRYEVALIVARLLQKEEQAHATVATKEQLNLVQQLAEQLRDELNVLGVRVQQVEEGVVRLDERVTELERITFYGSFESRMVDQTFTNRGNPDNDNQRGGKGQPGIPFLDYNQIVGASQGAILRPQVQGVIPVVDYRNGRSLVNGFGFTALARLGLKARLDADSEAGVEVAAFTSQGNQNVDAYWGVNGPYLANP